jgi:hypothetical protein
MGDRRFVLIALVAACVGLPTVSTAQPEGRAIWQFFRMDTGEMHLGYGVPETDDGAIGINCRPHARRYRIGVTQDQVGSHRVGSSWRMTIGLHSGAARGRYASRVTYNGEFGAEAEVNVPVTDRVMRAFAVNHRLGSDQEQWPARSRAENAAIDRFFAACR